MNSYTRYVLRQLFVGMVLVTAGLTCIIWLSQSLRFVEMIVNRGLSAGTFVYMTMLMLPNFLTIILPIALFAIIVFIYSKMVTDRELVVMRAAGVGQFGLAKPAMILTAGILAFGYLLNLYLLPESYRAFRILQWEIQSTYSHVLLKEGSFNPISKAVTVYVRERTPDGQLLGILVHDERDVKSPITLMAERGALVDSDEGPRVVMYNGNRQSTGKDGKLSILYFDRHVFEIPSNRDEQAVRFREPRERSMHELFHLEDQNDVSDHDWGKYKVELHKRFVWPLLSLSLAMVGLSCLLYGPITRRSQTTRILVAVGILISIIGATIGLENVIAKNLVLVPLLYLVALLPILVSTYVLMTHPKRSRAKRAQSKLKAA